MKFPISYFLKTKHCKLRYISLDDIPHIYEAAQYPGFTDGMLWDPPASEDELIEPYRNNVKAWEEDRAYSFTMETIDKADFVGRIAIRKQEEYGVWDLGFWTHPEQQGRGFMTEAVAVIIEFGFLELAARQILARHAIWNSASENVLKKNRMEFIRHIPQGYRKNGEWVEENLLGLTLDTWKMHEA